MFRQSLGASVLLAVNICFICSFSFYYHLLLLLLLLLLLFICLRVGVMSAGCKNVAILNCFARPPRVEVFFIRSYPLRSLERSNLF